MRLLARVLLLLLSGCGSAGPVPSRRAPGAEQLRYSVRLVDDMSRMEVELCFRGDLSGGLIPGRSEAGHRLRHARWLSPGPVRRLNGANGRIELPNDAQEGCIGYAVNLNDGGSLSAIVRGSPEQLLASPNAWLWRPYYRAPTMRAELSVTLPAGMSASLPWPRRNARYLLDASSFAFDSHAAFGRFRSASVQVDGVHASVAVLGTLPRVDDDGLKTWLVGAVRTAAQSDGQFPARLLQVVAVSEPGGREPFGSVARGGGASVLMFVPNHYDSAALRRDWVLPHELSHMLLPFVERDDAWLPEGLATYYQELLRARVGVLSQAEALDNLSSAMRSASSEGTGRSLCEESRNMHRTGAYRAVYWGGAAYWLLADISLRQAGGQQTLDALLSALRREARTAPPYRAGELVARLDELSGSRLFSRLAADCERTPFPDYERALHALGVRHGLPLDDGAKPLRDALFAAQPAK